MLPQAEERIFPKGFRLSDVGIVGGALLSAVSLTWLLYYKMSPLGGALGFWLACAVVFVGIYWVVISETENTLAATDKLMTVMITGGGFLLLMPLALIIGFVAVKGITSLTPTFFTETLATVGPLDPSTAGGALHAIVGTLEQVAIAMVISVPLGVMTAVFLNEIGGRLARPVRLFVDAMSGVPSIVAGLFIYVVWIIGLGKEFSGLAAGLALSILMLPTVTRTAEEVLRLVPGGLREASLALGSTEWRTTWNVVLPTAKTGLITAVILGVARAVGETAPLIMTSFGASALNSNPFSGPQDSLPLFVYNLIRSPQTAQIQRAWTGALVLILVVLILFTTARILGRPRAQQGSRRSTRTRRKANAQS